MRFPLRLLALTGFLSACGEPSDSPHPSSQSGGAAHASGGDTTSGGAASGGQAVSGTGGTTQAGSGGAASATGGSTASGGVASGGLFNDAGSGGQTSSGGTTGGSSTDGSGGDAEGATGGQTNFEQLAADLDELFIHDACTGGQGQSDTCTHVQRIEETITLGGNPNASYVVTLRVRGLFEPTNISGGMAPLAGDPYFVVGGTVNAADYSQWQIEVQQPHEVYTLNHYPQTSHTIYQQDFEAPIIIAGGSEVVVRVVDGNDRQIDNGTEGLPDRRQQIDGVTQGVLDGQALRLDVVSVEEQVP